MSVRFEDASCCNIGLHLDPLVFIIEQDGKIRIIFIQTTMLRCDKMWQKEGNLFKSAPASVAALSTTPGGDTMWDMMSQKACQYPVMSMAERESVADPDSQWVSRPNESAVWLSVKHNSSSAPIPEQGGNIKIFIQSYRQNKQFRVSNSNFIKPSIWGRPGRTTFFHK